MPQSIMRLIRPSTAILGTLAGLALLTATGCGVIGPGDSCTLIGCNSGLTVHLNAKPTGAYKVEVVSHPFVRIIP